MVIVCASFAMAAETPVCGHSIQEEEKAAQTAEIKATDAARWICRMYACFET